MASVSKSPLETYLTSIAETPSPGSDLDPSPPREISSTSSAGRVIILMILSQAGCPLPDAVLKEHSELSSTQYKQTMHELLTDGLIREVAAGYVLTDIGEKAAEGERSRLLMPR